MIVISLVCLGILFLANSTTLRELELLSKDWQIDWQSVGRRERFLIDTIGCVSNYSIFIG